MQKAVSFLQELGRRYAPHLPSPTPLAGPTGATHPPPSPSSTRRRRRGGKAARCVCPSSVPPSLGPALAACLPSSPLLLLILRGTYQRGAAARGPAATGAHGLSVPVRRPLSLHHRRARPRRGGRCPVLNASESTDASHVYARVQSKCRRAQVLCLTAGGGDIGKHASNWWVVAHTHTHTLLTHPLTHNAHTISSSAAALTAQKRGFGACMSSSDGSHCKAWQGTAPLLRDGPQQPPWLVAPLDPDVPSDAASSPRGAGAPIFAW